MCRPDTNPACRWPVALGLLACLVWFIGGCTVGPDFVPPAPPPVARYTQGQDPDKTVTAAGRAQRFEPAARIAADWWSLFKSPQLDRLIQEAVAQNANLQAAQARLRQSQELLRAGYGTFFPQVKIGFSATREKFSPTQFGSVQPGSTFNLYTPMATISYLLDVFGGQRRTVESLAAQADYQKYTAQATYLTLLGNVINTAVAQAAYQAEITATEQIIAFEQKQLRLTETQYQAGTVPYTNVVSVQAQLAATEATLPPLKQNLSKTRHLLTTLVGRTPAEWPPPKVTLADLTLPTKLPVTLPSIMVRQRPDIMAAEATLHAACANIGVATANLFPSFTLTGTYGQNITDLAQVFGATGNFWSLGAAVAQPIFQGGTSWYQRKAAIEAYKASLSDYRQVVLNSFQQVADTLRAVEHDAETLKAQVAALAAAGQARQLIQANYQAGLANYLQVLTADNQYQQAKLGYIQAQALRLQDTSALFVALGGGWWNPVINQEARNIDRTKTPKP